MKLTTFFLLAAILTVSANSLAQKVTLIVHDASLENVLQSLRQQTGYDYVGDEQLLDKADKVTLNLKDVQLRYALSQIFNNQPLTYSLENKAIIFKQKETSFIDKINAILALIDVNGRVTDSNGEPLPGASVIIKNSNIATTTDVNGFFKLTNVQPNAIVIISFIGFEKRELPVSANLGAIKLITSSSKLDEIQVVAYGATTQRLVTGSIAKVSSKEIQQSPESDPILSLAGRVAGVSITQNSGVAGSNFSINIRGQNSISAGKLPLYIVDGVPFGGQAVEQTAGTFLPPPSIIGSDGFNPLNVLSPDMIESIEILKDANATALYGSRAANGVIVITTKKGKAGATKLDANVYSGVSSVARTLPMLDASQYISMRQKAFANDGIIPTATNAPDLISFTPGWDTDYQKNLFSQGHFTNATVNLSGGNAETQFLFGSNFRYEEPIFAGNYADKIGHIKLSMQHASKDQRFKFNVSINYSSEDNSIPTFNLYNLYNLPPNLPLYTGTGALAWYTGYTNPISALINPVEQKNNDLLGNLSLNYSITKDLTFKTDAGYHTTNVDNVEAVLRAAQNPASASSANGVVYRNLTNTKLYNLEPQLNYSKQIAKGQLQALVGATYQYNNSDQPLFYFGTFTSDALYKDIGSVTLISKSTAYINNQHHEFYASVKPFTQSINRISQELYKAAKVNPNVKKEAWYMAKVDSINKYQSQYKEFHTQFYLTHPDSYLALTMFNAVITAGQLPLKEAQKQFDNFSPALKASDLGKNTANILAILGKRQVGVKVMDFTQPDTNGRSFSLSSLRGKYVLLDFWASWCGPCRTENPNVVKAYNELKGKNFEIVSISLDNNRAAWLNAINKDGMPWLHVCDLKGWKNDVAILFNIQSIPQNFLINPEGTIIAINLRGEDLDKRLATYIK